MDEAPNSNFNDTSVAMATGGAKFEFFKKKVQWERRWGFDWKFNRICIKCGKMMTNP
jgi:hypothetical protein